MRGWYQHCGGSGGGGDYDIDRDAFDTLNGEPDDE